MIANMLKITRKFVVLVFSFLLVIVFIRCGKDPVKGWTFYKASPPPPKITKLTSVIKNCIPPYPVTFYQETSNILGTMVYSWDFGDGYTSHDQNPTHIYTTPGIYKAKLKVSNEIGSDTASLSMPDLNLSSIPVVAGFTYQHFNNNNFAPNKVIFSNTSSGANQFYWYFGDGQEGNDDAPSHVFQSAGNYNVKLRGTCSDGSYNETTQQIFISPQPTRVFLDSINLMLPSGYKNSSIYIEMYHNSAFVGKTIVKNPSSYPIKFKAPAEFVNNNYFFDLVQFTSNEVFKFNILRSNGTVDPPTPLFELDLASVDIQHNFYPRIYYSVKPIPPVEDVFIDLYISY